MSNAVSRQHRTAIDDAIQREIDESIQRALDGSISTAAGDTIDTVDLTASGGYLGEDESTYRNLAAIGGRVINQIFHIDDDVTYGWLGINVAGRNYFFDVSDAKQTATADWAGFHTLGGAGVAITPDVKWMGATGTAGADYNFAAISPAGGGAVKLYVANTAHDNLLVGDVYADTEASNSGTHIYFGLMMFTSPAFSTLNTPWQVAER